MDKTPKYMKMCEEAFKDIEIIDDGLSYCNLEKIQNLWAHLAKDGTYCKFTQATMPEKQGWFQVYYQDQLQDILDYETYELLDICSESGGIMWQALHDYDANSMEQLWLAVVMKEKFNKIWDDKNEKWEEEDKKCQKLK